ncbi:hypothetical protein KFE98_03210 [bacterium SCSIO 12741]|nr:hypothetical protein KFE98_03210 [bacterium SCSIO 12741]
MSYLRIASFKANKGMGFGLPGKGMALNQKDNLTFYLRMGTSVHIRLLKKVQKKAEGGLLTRLILILLVLVLFPLLVVAGILVGVYLIVHSIISIGLYRTMNARRNTRSSPIWNSWLSGKRFQLHRRFEAEIQYGPSYYELKAEPKIGALQSGFYGDWHFPFRQGYLMQKWDSIYETTAQLIYLNLETGEIEVLLDQVPSYDWEAERTTKGTVQLRFDSGAELLVFTIDEQYQSILKPDTWSPSSGSPVPDRQR